MKGNKINVYRPVPLMNAFITGLVASSGNCGYVSQFGAILTGIVSGVLSKYV
jgi:ammonia channel protein AmtB